MHHILLVWVVGDAQPEEITTEIGYRVVLNQVPGESGSADYRGVRAGGSAPVIGERLFLKCVLMQGLRTFLATARKRENVWEGGGKA